MEDDAGKVEQILFRLMDYHAEQNVDHDGILIMLSLINLMGLINVLNSDGEVSNLGEAGTGNGAGSMEALLGSLVSLFTGGGKGGGKGGGQQAAPFNPAILLNLLGGGQGKGGGADLSPLFGLLGSLMGSSGGQGKSSAPDWSGLLALVSQIMGAGMNLQKNPNVNDKSSNKPQPVQREINLDKKNKSAPGEEKNNQEKKINKNDAKEKTGRIPKPGEVLKWNFRTG